MSVVCDTFKADGHTMKFESHPYSRTLCRVKTATGYKYFESHISAAEWIVRNERYTHLLNDMVEAVATRLNLT